MSDIRRIVGPTGKLLGFNVDGHIVERSESMSNDLLSGGRFSVLCENVVTATVLVPAFIAGQLLFGIVAAPNWPLCFGLCLGAYTFAVSDGIARRRAR